MKLDVLYRGPLASCNYGCEYCPFAKRKDSREQLATDRLAWRRFVDWAGSATDVSLGVLVTPWGEALIRRWYQEGLAQLSHLSHVTRCAGQTNLSAPLDWIKRQPGAARAVVHISPGGRRSVIHRPDEEARRRRRPSVSSYQRGTPTLRGRRAPANTYV
jgi:MoaA/NifB/PqqE/SkfB family radical SAM enzyme